MNSISSWKHRLGAVPRCTLHAPPWTPGRSRRCTVQRGACESLHGAVRRAACTARTPDCQAMERAPRNAASPRDVTVDRAMPSQPTVQRGARCTVHREPCAAYSRASRWTQRCAVPVQHAPLCTVVHGSRCTVRRPLVCLLVKKGSRGVGGRLRPRFGANPTVA